MPVRRTAPALAAALVLLVAASCTCGDDRATEAEPNEAPAEESASEAEQTEEAETDETSQASTDFAEETEPRAIVEITDELPVAEMVRANHERMDALRDAPVHVLRSSDHVEAGRRLCEAVVPLRPAATPVLLKPNLNGFDRLNVDEADEGWRLRTVDVEFLRGIVQCLHARGHEEISVIDAWKPRRIRHGFFARTGLMRLAQEEGLSIVHLWDDELEEGVSPVVRAHHEGARALPADLLVPRVLAHHLLNGLYISVPRLKMHRFTVVSASIKNAMGVVILDGSEPGHTRADLMHGELTPWWRRFRREHVDDRDEYVRTLELFAERMTDVLEQQLPDAVLIDAIPLVAGDGFALVEPYPGDGYAIGSQNPIYADAIGLEILGYLDNEDLEREIHHRTSPLVESAAMRFYETTDVLGSVRVIGDDTFRSEPRVAHFRGIPGFEIGTPPDPPAPLPWATD